MNDYSDLDRWLPQLRQDYAWGELHRKDLDSDPFAQFGKWFEEAMSAKCRNRNAMSLATAGRNGRPSVRILLLKGFSHEGFVFFTCYTSRKGQELEENPFASLMFYWAEIERQVSMEGNVSKLSQELSETYFEKRPIEAQMGAWASHQSDVLSSRDALDQKVSEFQKKFEGKKVPLPPNWGGYVLKPSRFEFWQGRQNRLNDRFLYKVHENQTWTLQRLSP